MKEILKNKKVMAAIGVALVIIIAVIIWAVSKDEIDPNVKSTPEVREAIEQSQTASEEADSVHSSMEIAMLIEEEDTEVNINVRNDSYVVEGENVQKQETIISLDALGTQAITTYVDLENKKSYVTADGGLSWQQDEISDEDVEIYRQGPGFLQFFTGIDNYIEAGTEKINGIMTDRYDGVIGAEGLAERIKQTGMLEQMGAGDLSDEQLKSISDEIGNVEVSMWIDPSTHLPQKMSVDMTAMMQKIMGLGEDEDFSDSLKEVTFTYVQSEYNAVEPIVIPEEAISTNQ